MFHEGYPKYYKIPATIDDSGNLWYLFLQGTAPGEMEYYISHPDVANDTCVRLLLQDHTYDTLKSVQHRINEFIRDRVKADPALAKVKVLSLGGAAGLYAAANDVLYQLDFINITFVLGIVFLFSAISFRSVVAGLLFIISCVMANFGAFIYMNLHGIGLTIDTIPVISLGIGLGVDYGIYVVARISDEVFAGESLESAIDIALRHTGAAVLTTFFVMIGGILPWTFSPLLFHSQMSILLIILMFLNMVSGCLILPCFIAWKRPRFCSVTAPVRMPPYDEIVAR
jgi:predicted RND superfamily exporter protein